MPRINNSKQKKRDQQRNHIEPRYHTQRWRIERKQQLMREPLCRICFETDTITAAQMVDHIKPVRLGGDFWNERNYQSLCNSCHAVKSAKESRLTRGRGISEE